MPPRKKGAARPAWNNYLTDGAAYRLNQEQLLKKKIQMLTKIPTEIPHHPPPLLHRAMTSRPRDKFEKQLRQSASLTSDERQKQELQREIDRMDEMLVSLELKANEIDDLSGMENQPEILEDDTTFTHEVQKSTPPTDVKRILLMVEKLQEQVNEERDARKQQDMRILELQKSLEMTTEAHNTLRNDFKQAVKHIVKLKNTITTLTSESSSQDTPQSQKWSIENHQEYYTESHASSIAGASQKLFKHHYDHHP
ncbi:hypothetical protein THRCLA_06725 [Thraustotheca clavata]|uniref:Uncharacterized protein n=1 Tax=Thraustotheca clavata TaxID=74557 RepID=A0A1V9ZK76_9STRA|nr:hypothetical protein THRCLA_06725 [Thraustotheca clavata]